ncbi:Fur family transcriptional regulator, ferric uptake regulator [Catalinimonas alkaloidigena]|uniref:Fur family transcriptional regulator, ferric uptake regulator n=2 Tax=Catalinimonas alkaloidigena TaxID=1075417 RepID=A0A1G9E109_9BACT|nr:Fur family transcriptional regulator, ferric uptake regulator [Catalinimonas alkaloidigena]
MAHDYALSHADIEATIDASIDRVTIYRTLKTFLDRGLLHKVLDDSGTVRYALCPSSCNESEHHHEHVHFKCVNCGQTQCVEEVHVPNIALPQGFQPIEVNMLVQGVCRACGKS